MDEENNLQKQLLAEYSQCHINSEDESDEESRKENKFGALIFVAFIWIQGIRSNSNLMYVPNEQQIYCSNGENKSYDALRFRCYVSNCQAKIYLKKNGKAVCERNVKHTHGSMGHKYQEMECLNEMKVLCLSAPVSTTTREIYDEAILK